MPSGEVPHSAYQGRANAGVRTRAGTASGRTAKFNYFTGGNRYGMHLTLVGLIEQSFLIGDQQDIGDKYQSL